MTATAAPGTAKDVAPGLAAARVYRGMTVRKLTILVGLTAALVVSVLLDVALGPSRLGLGETVSTVFDPADADVVAHAIVWDIRMPMAIMAVVVGAALAVSGAAMQTILNNPLAEPFTLGIAAAAGFGAATAIVFGTSVIAVSGLFITAANAWFFAILACLVIQGLSLIRGATSETMILLGIALVFLFSALLALLQFGANEQQLQQIVFWTMGSMTKSDWPRVLMVLVVLVTVMPLCARVAWKLTALRMGDDRAASLGVNVRRLRLSVLLAVSVLAATAVAFVGTIGFVGLVGPHVARMLLGEDQRYLLPGAAICGALLLSITSIVSKLIIPGVVIPVGIITALIGVPFFMGIIFFRRQRMWS
ncbi:MAG: iron ABC transporter permease [Gordonia sp. (in: high G+C Gram-positive bacteria)]|uniref:FecCD family ABC transporter permease n=1 Tax=Gordonia sp. (in: high G+C Gram-positive bacteria) TaxID=84139 RepID=UPI0039E30F20